MLGLEKPGRARAELRFGSLWFSMILAVLASAHISDEARATGQEPGSLLIFPYFDSHPSVLNIITVTNTNSNTATDPISGLQLGTIDVMFKYVDGEECSPENRVERLTPNDTFTFIAAIHNPEPDEKGFLYVYALDVYTGLPVAFDYLIGTETVFKADGKVRFNLNPLSFKGGTTGPDDHKLALDGSEYEMLPDEIQIPRFFGQGMGMTFDSPFKSYLLLMNFTGGAKFKAIADLLIYNDNEQVFSSTVEFDCWEWMDLVDVSAATRLIFLEGTYHDPDEFQLGPHQMEAGWIRINGNVSYNYTISYLDPAIYAIQIEEYLAGGYCAANLPFEMGEQDNGLLWSMSPNGQ